MAHQDYDPPERQTPAEPISDPTDAESFEAPAEAEAVKTSGRPAPPIQTVLGRFCDEFESNVRPLLEPMRGATEALAASPGDLPTRAILPALRDLTDQFGVLVDKVAEQQAYVLIFGPLKSGKSTFMNAICAKYVSEVTCLPAYPCLVQVSHADEPRYVVTRYNGESETFTDQNLLRGTVASQHRKLVEAIREAEEEGVDFEPQQHASDAIRRIDVKVPTGDLAESSAVLVDTPGLYSRMKFGYDRMTREFRDAAACAIFVVKTDNLFLDQVFDEFQDLLELFSRIFLIVNLDAAKQDLKPDGSLVPSLEHEDPQAVVQAFESLAMSAPLKAAQEDGRLRIYPVDLLGAASRRIRASRAGDDRGAVADEPRGQVDFAALLADLTDYLNSNEYLKAFLGDSLRRADSLLGELLASLEDESVARLRDEAGSLAEEQGGLNERGEAIERLRAVSWPQQLGGLSDVLNNAVREQGESIRHDAGNALNGVLDAWFESDASLKALIEQEITPALGRCRDDFVRIVQDELDRYLMRGRARLALPADVLRDLETVDIDLDHMARTMAQQLEFETQLAVPESNLSTEHIPVRRGFLDWLLFRGKTAVRKRLFGPREAPDRPIPPPSKAKRLGESARDAMRTTLVATLDQLTAHATQRLPGKVLEAYTAALARRLTGTLDEAESSMRGRLAEVDARLAEVRKTLDSLGALEERAATVSGAVARLRERFGGTDPSALRQPAESSAPSPEPAQSPGGAQSWPSSWPDIG